MDLITIGAKNGVKKSERTCTKRTYHSNITICVANVTDKNIYRDNETGWKDGDGQRLTLKTRSCKKFSPRKVRTYRRHYVK